MKVGVSGWMFHRVWYLTSIDVQSLIPVVMSGIIAVYSLVIAVLIAGDIKAPPDSYSLYAYGSPQSTSSLFLIVLQWIHAPGMWSLRRIDRSSRWLCDW